MLINNFMAKKLFYILILFYNSTYAQNRYKGAFTSILGLGVNVIDDSFTLKHKPFNTKEEWNYALYPSNFFYSAYLSESLNADFSITVNKYNKDKLVDGEYIKNEKNYTAFDLAIKYDLINAFPALDITPGFSPFTTFGTGLTAINDETRITVNYGLGCYFWLASLENNSLSNPWTRIGFFLQTLGKSSFNQKKFGNQIMHSAGLVYRIE
jgi:opacity protein-like surface antigen